jgi:hypothetical protein
MSWPRFSLFVLVPLAFMPAGSSQTRKIKFADCPVTIPRATPDSVLSGVGMRNAYWNGNLYVGDFWPDATVRVGPLGVGSILPDGSLEMKFPWFRAAGLKGKLAVTGRRLDTAAPPLKAVIPNSYLDDGFQATGLIFPTEGCWEITGKVGDTTLTFVNRVIRAE